MIYVFRFFFLFLKFLLFVFFNLFTNSLVKFLRVVRVEVVVVFPSELHVQTLSWHVLVKFI